MNKNTMPELFDEQPDGMEQPTQEQILMSESELLRGLIEAGNEKDSEASYERIQIKRGGKLKFEFRIRPISEEPRLPRPRHQVRSPEAGPAQAGDRDQYVQVPLLAHLHGHRR